MTGLVFVTVAGAWWWFLAPRVWTACDALVARERLSDSPPVSTDTPARSFRPASLAELAAACRYAARAQRSGTVAGAALHDAFSRHCGTSPVVQRLVGDLGAAVPVHVALDSALSHDSHGGDSDETRVLSLLVAGTVDSVLSPASLDRAADVLDDLAARRADVRIAAAHASLTVRFLTALPLGVGVLALVVSPGLRASWSHPAVVVPALVGVFLHLVGRAVVRRTVAAVAATAHEPVGSASRLADTVAAALAAGLTPAAACARLDADPSCGPRAAAVAVAIRHGAPLADALAPLFADHDTAMLAATVLDIAREGTNGVTAAVQLADTSRRERAERTRAAVAALPGRLSVPVTIFVLPSFLVGVLVPVVATGAPLS